MIFISRVLCHSPKTSLTRYQFLVWKKMLIKLCYHIAQIAPLSFQGSHRTQTQTSEVRWAARFSGHWVVTSMFAQAIPGRPSQRQLKKTSNGRRSQLNQYWSYKPHSNFKPTWKFLKDFVCVIQMILLIKIKNIKVGTGAQQQRQEVY